MTQSRKPKIGDIWRILPATHKRNHGWDQNEVILILEYKGPLSSERGLELHTITYYSLLNGEVCRHHAFWPQIWELIMEI